MFYIPIRTVTAAVLVASLVSIAPVGAVNVEAQQSDRLVADAQLNDQIQLLLNLIAVLQVQLAALLENEEVGTAVVDSSLVSVPALSSNAIDSDEINIFGDTRNGPGLYELETDTDQRVSVTLEDADDMRSCTLTANYDGTDPRIVTINDSDSYVRLDDKMSFSVGTFRWRSSAKNGYLSTVEVQCKTLAGKTLRNEISFGIQDSDDREEYEIYHVDQYADTETLIEKGDATKWQTFRLCQQAFVDAFTFDNTPPVECYWDGDKFFSYGFKG